MKQEVMILDTFPDLMNPATGKENLDYDDVMRTFSVPRQWLSSYLQKDRVTMKKFMSTYTWDETYFLYIEARNAGVLLSDTIAPR